MELKDKRFKNCVLFTACWFISGYILYLLLVSGIIPFVCPFATYFDIDCPLCGVTRMLTMITRFEFYRAFRYNMYIFGTMPSLIAVYTYGCNEYIENGKIICKFTVIFSITYIIGLLTFTYFRNTHEFYYLAPIDIT